MLDQSEFRGVVGLIYFIFFASPIFLLISAIAMIAKHRLAVIKNWRFWAWIMLLLVNLLVLLYFYSDKDGPTIQVQVDKRGIILTP